MDCVGLVAVFNIALKLPYKKSRFSFRIAILLAYIYNSQCIVCKSTMHFQPKCAVFDLHGNIIIYMDFPVSVPKTTVFKSPKNHWNLKITISSISLLNLIHWNNVKRMHFSLRILYIVKNALSSWEFYEIIWMQSPFVKCVPLNVLEKVTHTTQSTKKKHNVWNQYGGSYCMTKTLDNTAIHKGYMDCRMHNHSPR